MQEKNTKTVNTVLRIVGLMVVIGGCAGLLMLFGFLMSGSRLAFGIVGPDGQAVVPVAQVAPIGIVLDDAQDWTAPENTVPDGAMPLLRRDGTPMGYSIILYKPGPSEVSVPEGGFTIVACGNCKVEGVSFVSDGTIGNLILLRGLNPDGSTPEDLNETVTISDYTVGHVAVTTIWSVADEDPETAATNAVAGMFYAPNCGHEGCNQVDFFDWWPGMEVPHGVSYTEPPAVAP